MTQCVKKRRRHRPSRLDNGAEMTEHDGRSGPPPGDGGASGRSLLDPLGVLSLARSVARQVPGVSLGERQLMRLERRLLRELRLHLDSVDGGPPATHTSAESSAGPAAAPAPAAAEEPGEILDRLLRSSLEQTPGESRRAQFAAVLRQLVSDEARILAALSDGSVFALLHVAASGVASSTPGLVLENASNVGRAAGVALPGRVPVYVSHLRQLGLAEAGAEDATLGVEYDILSTEPEVRVAKAEADRRGRLPGRMVRRTLRISDFGRELWEACRAPLVDTAD
jgi:hypothetical protein